MKTFYTPEEAVALLKEYPSIDVFLDTPIDDISTYRYPYWEIIDYKQWMHEENQWEHYYVLHPFNLRPKCPAVGRILEDSVNWSIPYTEEYQEFLNEDIPF